MEKERETNMGKITVFLADDHTLVREGIKRLINSNDDMEVVAEADNGRDAIRIATKTNPTVALVDITMPGLNGLETTKQLRKECPNIQILILTIHTDQEYVFQALRAGAIGYVVKHAPAEDLYAAIRAASRGESFMSPSISRVVIEDYRKRIKDGEVDYEWENLTTREREVLQLIAEGHTNKDVARLLNISVKTVETHRARIMQKLDIHDVTGLTKYAIRKKLVTL
jgi:DNA-binding NarL/FixJ family response regulator